MQEATLIKTLKLFNPEELSDLDSFIKMSLFFKTTHLNQNYKLFTLLIKEIRLGANGNISRKEILETINSNRYPSVNSNYLDNRMSELMTLIRKYIAVQEVFNNWGRVFENIAMARFYRSKSMESLEEKEIRRAISSFAKKAHSLKDAPLLAYWIENERLTLETIRNNRKGDVNTSSTFKNLTIYYSLELLEIAAIIYQQENVAPSFNSEWTPLIKKFRSIIQSNNYFENPSVELLDSALRLLENMSINNDTAIGILDKFLMKIQSYETEIPFKITQKLTAIARNYCIKNISKGYYNLRDIQFLLYEEHLNKKLLFINNTLPPSTFINMINVGLKTEKFDWCLELLQTHSEKIGGENKEQIIQYSYAQYYLYIGQIDNAENFMLRLLQSKRNRDSGIEKLIRILELKILYESRSPIIESQLQNFQMFLSRSKGKVQLNQRKMDINFIKIIKRLILLSENSKNENYKRKFTNIENQLEDLSHPLTERFWLSKELKKLI